MSVQQNEENTLFLSQILTEYEVIPANFGWHIHQGDIYCGLLQYTETKGWQGSALDCIPVELRQQLKKLTQSSFSMPYTTTNNVISTTESVKVA